MRTHRGRAWRRAFAGTAAAGVVVAGVACSTGDTADTPALEDGATSADAGLEGEAGDAGADASTGPTTLLVKGDIDLIGVTTDGYVVYRLFDVVTGKYSLWAMELSGGMPIELSADLGGGEFVGRVINAGVGFWTGVDDKGLGTFNIWTKAFGIKSAAGLKSFRNFFTIPPAGTTVLFGTGISDGGLVDGSVASIDMSVAPLANLGAGAAIRDVNIAAGAVNCPPRTVTPNGGDSIFLTHCTGTNPNTVAGRIALATRLADGGVSSSVFLSDKDAGSAIFPFFGISSDTLASKLFVVGASPPLQGRVIDVATGTTTVLDPNVTYGAITADGGSVYYRTSASLKRASTDGSAKVTLVDGGFDHVLDISDDERRVLFASLPDPQPTDMQLVEAKPTVMPPMAVVADASVTGGAHFGASGETFIYAAVDEAAQTVDCYLGRSDGSAPRKVAASVFALCGRLGGTNVAAIGVRRRLLGPFQVFDLQLLDLSNPAAVPVEAEPDVDQLVNVFDGRIVIVKRGVQSGLYTRAVP
jgi:hypothetical protein